MIKVYFESNGCAAKIATFEDEDIYLLCLPALKKWAKANNGFITESCEEDAFTQYVKETNEYLSS